MKKQLLKFTLLTLVMLFGVATVQAQADLLWTKPGWYKLGARGTNLFMSINPSTGGLEWAEEITTGDASIQEWAVVDHGNPASAGYIQITATIPNVGNFTMVVDQTNIDGKNLTITARPGDPIIDDTDANYGYDQFQRRKAKVDANGDPDSEGSNPAAGNNALFAKIPGEGGSRYGVTPSAAGDPVKFDGAGIDVLDYHFVRDIATASVNTFESDAFIIANPVNNQLTIKGATSEVKEISLFSVLGNKVLSKTISGDNSDINLNVTNLSKGLYIIKMTGFSGERFTKKIIKE